jgi:hypothetical protein
MTNTIQNYFRYTLETLEGNTNIQKLDVFEEENLSLYCGDRDISFDDDPMSFRCRGTVFHEDRLILPGMPGTIEVDSIDEVGNLCDFVVYQSFDGTLVRVFNHNGVWYVSTNRRLDAQRSRWASRQSFKDQFLEHVTRITGMTIENFFENLDSKKKYFFLLKSIGENQICPHVGEKDNIILHIATANEDNDFDFSHTEGVCGLARPTDMSEYPPDLMMESFEKTPSTIQGLIFFSKTDNLQYKILTDAYKRVQRLRGNTPSIPFRYLTLNYGNDANDSDVIDFLKVYDHDGMTDTFNKYGDYCHKLVNHLYTAYMNRFVHKKHVVVSQDMYCIVRRLHSWYLEDPKNRFMTPDTVMEIVLKMSPVLINKIFRVYKNEERQLSIDISAPPTEHVSDGDSGDETDPYMPELINNTE